MIFSFSNKEKIKDGKEENIRFINNVLNILFDIYNINRIYYNIFYNIVLFKRKT